MPHLKARPLQMKDCVAAHANVNDGYVSVSVNGPYFSVPPQFFSGCQWSGIAKCNPVTGNDEGKDGGCLYRIACRLTNQFRLHGQIDNQQGKFTDLAKPDANFIAHRSGLACSDKQLTENQRFDDEHDTCNGQGREPDGWQITEVESSANREKNSTRKKSRRVSGFLQCKVTRDAKQ